MFRVAAAHLTTHIVIAARPEAGKIPGALEGTTSWGEQFKGYRQCPVEKDRSLAAAEHLLQLHREHCVVISVNHSGFSAARNLQPLRKQSVQLPALFPGEITPQRFNQLPAVQVLPAAAVQTGLLDPKFGSFLQFLKCAIGPWGSKMNVGNLKAPTQLFAAFSPRERLEGMVAKGLQTVTSSVGQ